MRIEADRISDFDSWSRFGNSKAPTPPLHESIFSYSDREMSFDGREIEHLSSSDDLRVETLFAKHQSGIAGGPTV